MKKLNETIRLPENIYDLKKKDLDKLCQDPLIAKFMKEHHLTRSMMDDYWIELLNFHDDYKICQKCQGLDHCPKNTMGYQMGLAFENNTVTLNMYPCEKESIFLKHEHTLSLIEPCNMPKSIFDIKLEELDLKNRKDVLLACQKLANHLDHQGIYLYGPMQNGKTTIMAALIYKFASKNIPCAFMNVPSLIVELKEQFSVNESKSDLMTKLKTIDILVLDDIGGENVTAWSRDEVLSSIISERALRKLPTFFTSVYSLEELKQYYVLSKLKGDTIKVERLIEKMKAVSMKIELKSGKFSM